MGRSKASRSCFLDVRKNWRKITVAQSCERLEKLRVLAKERGGACLSRQYNGSREKLDFECADGHHWSARPANITAGQWCPSCTTSMGENIVRGLLEDAFGTSFAKARPSWLRNDRGNWMELDGYSPKLKMAFEYQGRQHRESGWIMSDEALKQRQADDQRKEELCSLHGIELVVIHEVRGRVGVDGIRAELIAAMPKHQEKLKTAKVDVVRVYTSRQKKFALEFENAVEVLGGKVLGSYLFALSKVSVVCAKGHVFDALPADVKSGHWCVVCAGKKKLNIELFREIAKQRGGVCLSEKYVNQDGKLLWRCAAGHEFLMSGDQVKNKKQWCAACAGVKRLDIKLMRDLADQRGGKCLSTSYVNQKTPLLWACKDGHTWKATGGSIKNMKSWCPSCSFVGRGRNFHKKRLAQTTS